MRTLLIAATAMLALAGCQTASIDASIEKNLPAICAKAAKVHGAYELASLAVAVPAKVARSEAKAWAVLEPLCVDPSKATSADVLFAAFNALLTIQAARAEAG